MFGSSNASHIFEMQCCWVIRKKMVIRQNIQPSSNFWLHDTRSIREAITRNCVRSNSNTTVHIHYMSATFGTRNGEYRVEMFSSSQQLKVDDGSSPICWAVMLLSGRRNHSKGREHSSATVISTSINEEEKQFSWIPCWILGFVNSQTEINATLIWRRTLGFLRKLRKNHYMYKTC